MAIHTELEIYKVAYDLLDFVVDLIKNMERHVRPIVGEKMRDECLAVFTCIQSANIATDKEPHLLEVHKRLDLVNVLLRLSRDKRYISPRQHARAIELTGSIGKQASGWRKHASSPDALQPRLL